MTERYQYGELKPGTATINVKVKPTVKDRLNKLRGSKSWPKFMEEVARILDTKRTT